jgi:inosine-uridine nucleoside N-ribohydrolase
MKRFLVPVLSSFLALSGMIRAADKPLVIVDNDFHGPAGTNMQAALMFLGSPSVKILGFTVVSGDGWRDENAAHLLRLLEIKGRTDIPVYLGAAFPLINSKEFTARWEQMYGRYSYKGAWDNEKDSPLTGFKSHGPFEVPTIPEGNPKLKAASQNAALFMIEMVHKYPHQVSLYAAGPMTNFALAIKLDPEFASLAKELVFMGGILNPYDAGGASAEVVGGKPGSKGMNIRAMVNPDFNIVFDPEAAHIVLHAPWAHIVSVGDVTAQIVMTDALADRIASVKTPVTEYIKKFAQRHIPIWDEITAALTIDRTLVTRSQSVYMNVDIDHGASYGVVHLIPDGRNPGLGEQKVEIVTDLDTMRLTDQFVKAMQQN